MLVHFVADWFTPLIFVLGAVHLATFFALRYWAGRDVRGLAQTLERFTDNLHGRSRMDWRGHLTDQIDAFIEDIREATNDPTGRQKLRERISILDEQRSYLESYRFENIWNVARSGIEVYPLLGVLGTILALWLAMGETSPDDSSAVATIVERFGLAIDSTFAGLAVAISLMVVHSFYETLFTRLSENRLAVRNLVVRVRQDLLLSRHASEEDSA
tara:strand:- start:321586 stop:322230 length:645 start_codon:yes stop_codon:yes gene_type:complete